VRLQETQHERVAPRAIVEYEDPTDFDRIAFAMRALAVLRPRRMTVAVFSASSSLHVTSGRVYGGRDGAAWAMVGIPPHASREHIAYALAELAGAASIPYAVRAVLATAEPAVGA
jgi:hypothetical protein